MLGLPLLLVKTGSWVLSSLFLIALSRTDGDALPFMRYAEID